MSIDPINIAEWLTQPYVDAVPWREAADGDLVLLRDPSTRGLALADAYVIDGVPTYDREGNLDAYTRRVQGDPELTWSYRKAARRIFNGSAFQVWRNWQTEISEDLRAEEHYESGTTPAIRVTDTELVFDDMAGTDLRIERLVTVDTNTTEYLVTIDEGYRGDRGESCSIQLPVTVLDDIVAWLLDGGAGGGQVKR